MRFSKPLRQWTVVLCAISGRGEVMWSETLEAILFKSCCSRKKYVADSVNRMAGRGAVPLLASDSGERYGVRTGYFVREFRRIQSEWRLNERRRCLTETRSSFQTALNKTYDRDYVEARCRKAFEENVRAIRKHNSAAREGSQSFYMRANDLADMSSKDYLQRFVRLQPSKRVEPVDRPNELKGEKDVIVGAGFGIDRTPDSLDWRERGFRTGVKNQKSCGSCYAFSIALSVEGQIFKRTGRLVDLSAQQIVDCSASYGNHGCSGGSLRNTLRYLEKTQGLMREQDYPYLSSVRSSFCFWIDHFELVAIRFQSWPPFR